MYEDMVKYVKEFLDNSETKVKRKSSKFPFRNRFEHTLRVYKWALRINEAEKGDLEIVSISAIFHDIGKVVKGDRPHAVVGAELCEDYLNKQNYPEDRKIRILQAIRYHSSKSNTDLNLNLEDKILMDADMLDEVGALAIIWDSMAVASDKDPSYYKAYKRYLKFYKHLTNHQMLLKTNEGKRLYMERLNFLKLFIDNLEYELGLE